MIAAQGDLAVCVFVDVGESGSQTAGPDHRGVPAGCPVARGRAAGPSRTRHRAARDRGDEVRRCEAPAASTLANSAIEIAPPTWVLDSNTAAETPSAPVGPSLSVCSFSPVEAALSAKPSRRSAAAVPPGSTTSPSSADRQAHLDLAGRLGVVDVVALGRPAVTSTGSPATVRPSPRTRSCIAASEVRVSSGTSASLTTRRRTSASTSSTSASRTAKDSISCW